MKNLIVLLLAVLVACNHSKNNEKSAASMDSQETISSTETNKVKIEDEKAEEVIQKSMAFHGGIDRWRSIKNITYKKDYNLYDADGASETSHYQEHSYDFEANTIEVVSSQSDELIITNSYNDGEYARYENGVKVDADPNDVAKSIHTSTYVFGVPFNLMDGKAKVKYLGKKSIDGKDAHEIEFVYKGTPQSSSDTWRYYFDVENYAVVANWVATSDHYSWLDNLTYEEVGGLLLHGERESYRMDEEGNKLYLRADYQYYDYQITFFDEGHTPL